MVQPIRSPENPGTTVVSIGHLIPWPENPGYRTQVWDNKSIQSTLGPLGCSWIQPTTNDVMHQQSLPTMEGHANNFTSSYSGPRFNIKMSSYQNRKSHCGDKKVVRSSHLHNGISYTGKTASLYWIGAQWTYFERWWDQQRKKKHVALSFI